MGFEEHIWAYLGGIARENQIKALKIGGVDNHVHLLLGIPPALAVSKAVQLIKGGSSVWIKETFPGLSGFGWQDGYGAFTVSKSLIAEVEHYIVTQREHHRLKTFEEEYRTFLANMKSPSTNGICLMGRCWGEVKRPSATRGFLGHRLRGLKPTATIIASRCEAGMESWLWLAHPCSSVFIRG